MAAKRKKKKASARRRVPVKAHCRKRSEPAWLKNLRKSKAMPF